MSLKSQEPVQGVADSFAIEKTATIGKYVTCLYGDAGTTEKVSFHRPLTKPWNLDKKRAGEKRCMKGSKQKASEADGVGGVTTWGRCKQKAD